MSAWYWTFLFHRQERPHSKRAQHGPSSGKDGVGDSDIAGMLTNFSKALGRSLSLSLTHQTWTNCLFTFMTVRAVISYWGWTRCVNFLDIVSFTQSLLGILKLYCNKKNNLPYYIALIKKMCLITTSPSSMMQTLMLSKHFQNTSSLYNSLTNLILLKCIIRTKLNNLMAELNLWIISEALHNSIFIKNKRNPTTEK